MDSGLLIALIISMFIVQAVGLWFLLGRKKDAEPQDDRALRMLQGQIENLERALDARMAEFQDSMDSLAE